MTRHDSHVEYWNDPAVAAGLIDVSNGVSDFAKECEERLAPGSQVLDLGCGAGDDAAYFAEQGHSIWGIDVSTPLVTLASQRYADMNNLHFRQADITKPLPVGGQSCDLVYSRLSLHYFDDETTARIFNEIAWSLRHGGWFHFLSKSVDDPLHGKGIEIGADMYDLDGHVRHFFSREYALEMLEDANFQRIQISTGSAKFYGQPSAYVKCAGFKP